MSIELQNIAHKKFEAEAIQAFQDMSKLKGTTRVRDSKNASQYQFQVIGKTIAEERGAIQTDVPLSDVTHQPVTATIKRYVIAEMTDIFDDSETSVDERSELVESMVMSLGRRLDQIIIDALKAATLTKTVDSDVGGAADNLNVAMFNRAAELLGSDVPEQNRYLLCHDSGFYHFLLEADVKDFDINITKALANGKVAEYHGFKIIKMADRAEGGLDKTGDDRQNFAWQKSAVGLAMNMKPKIRIDYIPRKMGWQVSAAMSAGAVVIQEEGVVEITTFEG